MLQENWHWFAFLLIVPGTIIFFFVFLPAKLVKFQGRFYESFYNEQKGFSDRELDSFEQSPWDKYLMGRRSQFVREASDRPEQFPKLIRTYRIIGIVMSIPWIAALITIVVLFS